MAEAEGLKRMRLRRAGTCSLCGLALGQGTEAYYQAATRTVRCLDCPAQSQPAEPTALDMGVAGGSAQSEFDRRRDARAARVKGRLGNFVGGVVLGLSDEPQSTRAWASGAVGERGLAHALGHIEGLQVLHDRSVPGTRGNIDHIVVAAAGVFVVDAKHYRGLIRIRDRGGIFKTDNRLYVGSHDCSELADNMGWQVTAVQAALSAAGIDPAPTVTPVLCFVDGEWPLFGGPDSYKGVRLEGKRSIKKLVSATGSLDPANIERLVGVLAKALPAKS